MADFEEQLNLLLQEAADIYSPLGIGFLENDNAASKWMNDVQIFNDKYLKEHPLGQRMKTLLFHRPNNAVGELMTCLQSIQGDRELSGATSGKTKSLMEQKKQNLQLLSSPKTSLTENGQRKS